MTVRERAAHDRAEGRLWKARDRLLGAIANSSTDPGVLDDLAQIYWEMGDAPAAGRYWYLTDRDDATASDARALFEERFGGSAQRILTALPLKVTPDVYPPKVRRRLEDLIERANAQGYSYRAPVNFGEIYEILDRSRKQQRFRDGLLVLAAFVVFGGGWLVGLFTIVTWVS